MSYPETKGLKSPQATPGETGNLACPMLRVRGWMKSSLLAIGVVALASCATHLPTVKVGPAVNVVRPKEVPPALKEKPQLEKPQQNPQPKPVRGGETSPLNRSDPDEEDCMDIDRDQPGACDIA